MGSLPQLSVVKGPNRDLKRRLIHRLFEDSLNASDAKHFSATALIERQYDGSEQLTDYAHLNGTANRYARCLLRTIAEVDDDPRRPESTCNADGDWIVAVCMQPSARLVATLLAIWKAGAAYLPIDAAFPLQRVQHIMNEARPALVVFDADYADAAEAFAGVAAIGSDDLHERSAEFSAADVRAGETLCGELCDLAIVLYTSGSTGVPKGVRLSHSVVQNRLQWQFEAFPFGSDEQTGVFKTALTFVDSIAEIWGPLLNRMSLLIIPKTITKDPERLVEVLEHYGIRRMVLVPTLLRSLLLYLPMRAEPGLLHGLRIWVCSGEPLSVQLASEFYDYFIEGQHMLCNFYGSTEIMGDVTYFVCESKLQLSKLEKVPIGYPISNTMIYVLDDEYRPVKLGETGELFVAGLNLACGYVNGRDKFRFVENPLAVDPKFNRLYRTGDYASVRKGGAIQYEGRTDSQIKIRGHRVDLSEVERHLFALDGLVDKGMVLCYHAGEIDQALLGFVTVPEGKSTVTGLQIENALGGRLADYMIPQILVMEAIPLLVNGKVDRQALLKSYENANNNDDPEIVLDFDFTDVPEAQMSVAKELFETIGQVIGRSARTTISLKSNFYQLGGNSLNSIYTVAQLRNQGHFIGVGDFIKAKTLRDVLAKLVDAQEAQKSDDEDDTQLKLRSTPLQMRDKSEVIELMTRSFYEKADLERWMKPDILYTDYGDIFEGMFEHFVANEICFIVWDQNDRMVGVALNTDANDEPEIEIHSRLSIVFEFLEEIEGPIREHQLPQGKRTIFHTLMMGTNAALNAQENITVMQFMETEVLQLAQRKRYIGILTTNTSPLTQQLGTHVYGYETLLNYQVNKYTSPDGTRPFGKAPNSQRALVQWKRISNDGNGSE